MSMLPTLFRQLEAERNASQQRPLVDKIFSELSLIENRNELLRLLEEVVLLHVVNSSAISRAFTDLPGLWQVGFLKLLMYDPHNPKELAMLPESLTNSEEIPEDLDNVDDDELPSIDSSSVMSGSWTQPLNMKVRPTEDFWKRERAITSQIVSIMTIIHFHDIKLVKNYKIYRVFGFDQTVRSIEDLFGWDDFAVDLTRLLFFALLNVVEARGKELFGDYSNAPEILNALMHVLQLVEEFIFFRPAGALTLLQRLRSRSPEARSISFSTSPHSMSGFNSKYHLPYITSDIAALPERFLFSLHLDGNGSRDRLLIDRTLSLLAAIGCGSESGTSGINIDWQAGEHVNPKRWKRGKEAATSACTLFASLQGLFAHVFSIEAHPCTAFIYPYSNRSIRRHGGSTGASNGTSNGASNASGASVIRRQTITTRGNNGEYSQNQSTYRVPVSQHDNHDDSDSDEEDLTTYDDHAMNADDSSNENDYATTRVQNSNTQSTLRSTMTVQNSYITNAQNDGSAILFHPDYCPSLGSLHDSAHDMALEIEDEFDDIAISKAAQELSSRPKFKDVKDISNLLREQISIMYFKRRTSFTGHNAIICQEIMHTANRTWRDSQRNTKRRNAAMTDTQSVNATVIGGAGSYSTLRLTSRTGAPTFAMQNERSMQQQNKISMIRRNSSSKTKNEESAMETNIFKNAHSFFRMDSSSSSSTSNPTTSSTSSVPTSIVPAIQSQPAPSSQTTPSSGPPPYNPATVTRSNANTPILSSITAPQSDGMSSLQSTMQSSSSSTTDIPNKVLQINIPTTEANTIEASSPSSTTTAVTSISTPNPQLSPTSTNRKLSFSISRTTSASQTPTQSSSQSNASIVGAPKAGVKLHIKLRKDTHVTYPRRVSSADTTSNVAIKTMGLYVNTSTDIESDTTVLNTSTITAPTSTTSPSTPRPPSGPPPLHAQPQHKISTTAISSTTSTAVSTPTTASYYANSEADLEPEEFKDALEGGITQSDKNESEVEDEFDPTSLKRNPSLYALDINDEGTTIHVNPNTPSSEFSDGLMTPPTVPSTPSTISSVSTSSSDSRLDETTPSTPVSTPKSSHTRSTTATPAKSPTATSVPGSASKSKRKDSKKGKRK